MLFILAKVFPKQILLMEDNMGGLILCFTVPGVLVGILLGQSVQQAKRRARLEKAKHAQKHRKALFIYDLREDQAAA